MFALFPLGQIVATPWGASCIGESEAASCAPRSDAEEWKVSNPAIISENPTANM
jgi:hypothetical protein